MAKQLERTIRGLAANRCEYCHMPDQDLGHVLDHIIARQHGGKTVRQNLALCCGRCNKFKGPNISGIDAESGHLTRLFHPRRGRWHEHFKWEGQVLVGRKPVGRTTVAVLSINHPIRLAARRALLTEGGFV